VEEDCELTELPKSMCAHCRELVEDDPNDISGEDEYLDWLDG
jgi:hypothetical protein